jgi:hypothetical protein
MLLRQSLAKNQKTLLPLRHLISVNALKTPEIGRIMDIVIRLDLRYIRGVIY